MIWPNACALLLAASVLVGGCDEGRPHLEERLETPAPLLEVFSVAPPKARLPTWMTELPKTRATVVVGDMAWATLPQANGELAAVAVVRIAEVSEDTVSVVDKTSKRFDAVPAGLVHALGDKRGLKANSLALFYTWTTPGWLGRVRESERGEELRVEYDWLGTTRETPVDHAEAVRIGIRPLAFVAYPRPGGKSVGRIVAQDDERAWLLAESGHVDVVPRNELEALDLRARDFEVGRRVRAYRWGTGLEPGVISKVIEPGLRYEVSFGAMAPEASYFVATLVEP